MTQNLPAYLQNKQNRGMTEALEANLGVGSPPYLSLMGNRFTLIDSAGEEIPISTYDPKLGPYVDCCIMDILERTSKIFYEKPFDVNAGQWEPPTCFSDNGIAPSRNASKPQARTCAECTWSAWGSKTSAISGKGVKACADQQKIAILVPPHEMPFLVRVPPNSRKNLRAYNEHFKGKPFEMCDVMTRIYFVQGAIGTLNFAASSFLDEKALVPQRDKLIAAKATDSMVGRTDLPRDTVLPAPATVAQIEAQPAPFVTGTPEPQPMQMAPAPQPQAPIQQPTQRRRRNTAAAPVPQAQPAQEAPFMQQPAQPNGPASNFGIQQAAEPNKDIQNTLNSLFGS